MIYPSNNRAPNSDRRNRTGKTGSGYKHCLILFRVKRTRKIKMIRQIFNSVVLWMDQEVVHLSPFLAPTPGQVTNVFVSTPGNLPL